MNLKFKSIADAGNVEDERIVLSVAADADVGSYLILITEVDNDGSPYSGHHDSYWFPDKKLKSGDLVILYTKSGISKSLTNSDGSSSHFFYWGLGGAQFKKSKRGIVLLRAPQWEKGIP